MITTVREQVKKNIEAFAKKINLKGGKVLEVGIGGDEKPGGNHYLFGKDNDYKTLDKIPAYGPDYIMDITKTSFSNNKWDLVICSQTLEHIYDIHGAVFEIHRITKKYAIIDCPFMFKFHPERGFGDFWRISPEAMHILCRDAGFKEVKILFDEEQLVTSALCTKETK